MSALITPEKLQHELPLTLNSVNLVNDTRNQLIQILNNQDDRLLVIVGPCSLHHPDSAIRYAEKLQSKIKQYEKTLCIVMRAYIEKARTSIGWKGLVNDPDLNNTFRIEKGLHVARSVLLAINELGVPTGTEILNPLIAPFFTDLTSWAVIGARTTESQTHREYASSLPIPIGFKNNTNGDIQVAIDAIQTAQQPHHFLGPDLSGKMAIMQSAGNPFCHVVLRGSNTQSNCDIKTVSQTTTSLKKLNLIDRVLIDCSHGNSQKNHIKQFALLQHLSNRLQNGDNNFFGVMIESHLVAGKQTWVPHQPVNAEQSITDTCMGWPETEMALDQLSQAVQIKRKNVVDCSL